MKTSQQKLLDYIEAQQIVSAADLSLALKMTQANARHHLHILLSQGVIEIAGERPQPQKGRPAKLYRISAQKYGDNLSLLTGAALLEIKRLAGETGFQESLQRIASAILRNRNDYEAKSEVRKSASLTLRLAHTITALNEMHYEARWEAHRDAPRIVLGRCPYQPLLENHPEMCQMDIYLITSLLGLRVNQIAKLNRDKRGNVFCLFTTGRSS